MSYKFVDSFRAGAYAPARNKFVKLVHLVGFIIKKYIKYVMSEFCEGTEKIKKYICQYVNRRMDGDFTIIQKLF
jgi:hypothetical protein